MSVYRCIYINDVHIYIPLKDNKPRSMDIAAITEWLLSSNTYTHFLNGVPFTIHADHVLDSADKLDHQVLYQSPYKEQYRQYLLDTIIPTIVQYIGTYNNVASVQTVIDAIVCMVFGYTIPRKSRYATYAVSALANVVPIGLSNDYDTCMSHIIGKPITTTEDISYQFSRMCTVSDKVVCTHKYASHDQQISDLTMAPVCAIRVDTKVKYTMDDVSKYVSYTQMKPFLYLLQYTTNYKYINKISYPVPTLEGVYITLIFTTPSGQDIDMYINEYKYAPIMYAITDDDPSITVCTCKYGEVRFK